MIIFTKEGKSITINKDTKLSIDGMGSDYPHWGWLVLWLLLFYPACIVWVCIGLSRKCYNISVDDVSIKVNEVEYVKICNHMGIGE